ncbi:MAG: tetratricopeptide repeat protein [Persicimonas sp.]
MSKSLRPKSAHPPGLDWTIVLGFTICALLAAGFGYWRLSQAAQISEDSFAFEELQIDRERLDRQRQKKYGDINLRTAQAEWQRILAAARELNRGQFTGLSQTAAAELSLEIKFLANELIPTTGYQGFVVSGEPLFHQCQEGLDELLEAVRTGQLSMKEAREAPPADTFETYRDNCGNFLPLLVDRGLVTEDAQWAFEQAPIIVDLLNRYRWAHIIHDQQKPEAQLTAYGLITFERWRVERASGVTDASRQKYLERLARHDPDYNADYARGVLAFRAGELEEALEHFEKLASAYPASDYRGYADYLRDRLEASGNEVVAEGEKTH